MKKKKGFTLIELIISIAFLAIVMIGILYASLTITKLRAKNNLKIDMSNYTQSIIEQLKSKSISQISSLSGNYYFIYFNDDMADINTWMDTPTAGTPYNLSCLTNYPTVSNKKYGALIFINNEPKNSVDSYHIYVRVWALKTKNQSISDFYMSR